MLFAYVHHLKALGGDNDDDEILEKIFYYYVNIIFKVHFIANALVNDIMYYPARSSSIKACWRLLRNIRCARLDAGRCRSKGFTFSRGKALSRALLY